MTAYRCILPSSFGLMGDTFNTATHTDLKRLFAECDRFQAEFEWDEYLRAEAAKDKTEDRVQRQTNTESKDKTEAPGLSHAERRRFDAWYTKIQKGET